MLQNDQWRHYLKTVQLFGAVEITKRSCINRYEEILVPYGTIVTYENEVLLLQDTVSTGETRRLGYYSMAI